MWDFYSIQSNIIDFEIIDNIIEHRKLNGCKKVIYNIIINHRLLYTYLIGCSYGRVILDYYQK